MFKDRVFIEGLSIITTIGVYEWEKSIKQKLILDIEMAWDNRIAGLSDDVNDCLNYAQISQAIIDYLQHHQFNLIESVAENVAALLIDHYFTPWVRVKVSKPTAVASARNVAIMIERQKENINY
ncbi:dihydroneopterin aldolase [Frischella sp. Ac48]|uniref:7,8-dihydroneopterin aldolase n=1 Tax=Frischella japonica TaxID=2741544 RepID=A0ABR7QXU4_9GAMM|nr:MULTISPECIES: dihydroneopterin aldolase [Frischella]MBC9131019.1 dihydroneopterin aldolase [Frischella japonica]MBX4133844.1 dihydroneopterin aldolase [Frischella sp. Ac48]